MPFDESTITGFMISLALQSAAGYTFMVILMSVLLYFMGFYLYTVAFVEDFQWIFNRLNEARDHATIKKCFIDAINLHVQISG